MFLANFCWPKYDPKMGILYKCKALMLFMIYLEAADNIFSQLFLAQIWPKNGNSVYMQSTYAIHDLLRGRRW